MSAVEKTYCELDTTLVARKIINCLENGGKVVAFGCGGSSLDASHFCTELVVRYKRERKALPAISINEPSYLTAVVNDFGENAMFMRAVEALVKPEDFVLGISTSGKSLSVLLALDAAKLMGAETLLLTGNECDVEDICLMSCAGYNTAEIQETHRRVLHELADRIDEHFAD